jgi:hypothetical protein
MRAKTANSPTGRRGREMNNEMILEKLIELGVIKKLDDKYIEGVDVPYFGNVTDFDPLYTDSVFILVLNALVTECGKKKYVIDINHNKLKVSYGYGEVYYGDYTRSDIVKAFCKVTGIEI